MLFAMISPDLKDTNILINPMMTIDRALCLLHIQGLLLPAKPPIVDRELTVDDCLPHIMQCYDMMSQNSGVTSISTGISRILADLNQSSTKRYHCKNSSQLLSELYDVLRGADIPAALVYDDDSDNDYENEAGLPVSINLYIHRQ